MLPGTRTFSDADIVQTVRECVAVYDQLNGDEEIPAELRPLVFQTIVNMIGNRQVAGPLPTMHIPRNG